MYDEVRDEVDDDTGRPCTTGVPPRPADDELTGVPRATDDDDPAGRPCATGVPRAAEEEEPTGRACATGVPARAAGEPGCTAEARGVCVTRPLVMVGAA